MEFLTALSFVILYHRIWSKNQSKKTPLPPLLEENKHKKTLVLDLDETLVHSTFIKSYDADFAVPVNFIIDIRLL